jgi:hypothetical protein
LDAISRLSRDDPQVGVSVADIDRVIGRADGDMRTPLNLQSLADENHVMKLPDASWTLTAEGLAWLTQDRELSDR